jgi:Tol biopolymer transport system component
VGLRAYRLIAATAGGTALAVTVAAIASPSSVDSARKSNVAETPDGLLVFDRGSSSRGDNYPTAAYVVRTDGTGVRRLTMPCHQCFGSPRWSPDGSRIALSAQTPNGARIVVIKPDGSGRRTFGAGDKYFWAESPAWSPNGRQIAFALDQDEFKGLAIVSADGSGLRRLPLREKAGITQVEWSPDGKQLLVGDDGNRLYLLRLDGTRLRLITRNVQEARWSADGALLVLRGDQHAIYLLTPKTLARRMVREFPSARIGSVSWSSDGKRIAYSDYDRGIYILDLISGRAHKVSLPPNLCTGTRFCVNLDWQRRP